MASGIYQWIDCDYEKAGIQVNIEELRTDFIRLRKQRGMGQKEAAKIAGVSQTAISSFELGKYGTIHPKTLKGVYKLVQTWKGDAAKLANVSILRKQDAYPEKPPVANSANALTQCRNCHKLVASPAESPFVFCPYCQAPLERYCKCGSVVTDVHANFCSHCGRTLLENGDEPHSYPLLTSDPQEKTRMQLRIEYQPLESNGLMPLAGHAPSAPVPAELNSERFSSPGNGATA